MRTVTFAYFNICIRNVKKIHHSAYPDNKNKQSLFVCMYAYVYVYHINMFLMYRMYVCNYVYLEIQYYKTHSPEPNSWRPPKKDLLARPSFFLSIRTFAWISSSPCWLTLLDLGFQTSCCAFPQECSEWNPRLLLPARKKRIKKAQKSGSTKANRTKTSRVMRQHAESIVDMDRVWGATSFP